MTEGRKISLKAVSLGTSIPATFAGLVMGGFYLGRYFDRLWGTQPWLLLLGTFGGMALGGFYFTYVLKALGMTKHEK
ncbi:MAG: AtpZ/AtpI family protein [Desulfitobacteriaceae bacterium]